MTTKNGGKSHQRSQNKGRIYENSATHDFGLVGGSVQLDV